jgi:hypothetical protein
MFEALPPPVVLNAEDAGSLLRKHEILVGSTEQSIVKLVEFSLGNLFYIPPTLSILF